MVKLTYRLHQIVAGWWWWWSVQCRPLLHVLLWDWCLVGLGMYLFAGCWFILSVSIIECALFARLPHNIHILYIRVSQIQVQRVAQNHPPCTQQTKIFTCKTRAMTPHQHEHKNLCNPLQPQSSIVVFVFFLVILVSCTYLFFHGEHDISISCIMSQCAGI